MLDPDATYDRPESGQGPCLNVLHTPSSMRNRPPKPSNPTLLVCAVCKDSKDPRACAGCHTVFYCGKEHQQQDWVNHKASCKLWKIRTTQAGHTYWIASRDLEAGTLIYVDMKPTLTVNSGRPNDESLAFSCEIRRANFPYNHSCNANCRFDAFLKKELKNANQISEVCDGSNAMVLVHTVLPISKGQELTVGGGMRYIHLGTHYRRQVMRDHHGYICNCIRCRDPTEMGSYTSAIVCQKCRKDCIARGENDPLKFGYFLPIDPLEFGGTALWECRGCGDKQPAKTVLAPVIKIYDGLIANNFQLNVREVGREEICESLIEKYRGQLLHPNHWVLIKADALMIYHSDVLSVTLNNEGLPDYLVTFERKRLEKYVERISKIFSIYDMVSPGLTKKRGELLGGQAKAKFYLANQKPVEQMTQEDLQKAIEENKEILKQFQESVIIDRMEYNPKDFGTLLTDFKRRMDIQEMQVKNRIEKLEKLLEEMIRE